MWSNSQGGSFILEKYEKLILDLLNLKPSSIKSIDSCKTEDDILLIRLVLSKPSHCECPYCSSTKLLSKGYIETKINHSMDYLQPSVIYCKKPRYRCTQCHKTFTSNFYLNPQYTQITYATIQKIMYCLKSHTMTFTQTAKIVGCSIPTVIRTFDKYCHLAPLSFPEVLCIDEVYTKNSDYDSKYSCIFYDFFQKTVIDVTPCRKKHYLLNYLDLFSQEERNVVKFVCIDMHRPFKDVIQLKFKKAIICVDSFHVIKTLNDCVANIRMRILRQYDSSTQEYYLIKNWKWLLLGSTVNLDNRGEYNKRFRRHMTYRDLLNAMLSIHPDLQNAYELKEAYLLFNATGSLDTAAHSLDEFYARFVETNIPEFADFISAIYHWKDEIINSFTIVHGRRISNGIAESLNAKIQLIIYNSKGIHNSERRKKRIIYALNKNSFSL